MRLIILRYLCMFTYSCVRFFMVVVEFYILNASQAFKPCTTTFVFCAKLCQFLFNARQLRICSHSTLPCMVCIWAPCSPPALCFSFSVLFSKFVPHSTGMGFTSFQLVFRLATMCFALVLFFYYTAGSLCYSKSTMNPHRKMWIVNFIVIFNGGKFTFLLFCLRFEYT